tara:strand:+ start:134 stop:538 length:405 start_codon:yes stop_codon:yes gene_type:complete
MKSNEKNNQAYKTIGEAAKELDLLDEKTGNLQTHTIRYWETQFRQLKPDIKAGRRRYYSPKNIELLIYIKYLLKEKGLTINGVKKILNDKGKDSIDDSFSIGVYKPVLKKNKLIKDRIKNISKIIKELKKFKNG